jgi:hypothetical protein
VKAERRLKENSMYVRIQRDEECLIIEKIDRVKEKGSGVMIY